MNFDQTKFEKRPLVWRVDLIPGYEITNTGKLYHLGRECHQFRIGGRNYCTVYDNDKHKCSYRVDYMVAYTFLGFRPDAIRLIHINDDIMNDHVSNLMWYCKSDLKKEYVSLAIVENDGSIREEWRPCRTEYNPDLGYEVSNMGMIRNRSGALQVLHISHGYRVFYYLDKIHGDRTRVKGVHQAVAEAFIPNPMRYPIVNHIDGDPFNNLVTNLEWNTNGMNAEHAYLQGLNNGSGYTAEQIHAVCKLLSAGDQPQVTISFITGVDRKTISDIYRGRRWTEIRNMYKMPEKKWTPELKSQITDMIIAGKKGREIYQSLDLPYDQPAISLYERLRRELKAAGKIS